MKIFWIILIVVLVLIYILSPIDGIPDIIPLLGWLDDTFMVGLLAYYLRYKRLPNFLYRLGRIFFQGKGSEAGGRARESAGQKNSGSGQAGKNQTPSVELAQKKFVEIQEAYRFLTDKHS